MRHLVQLCVLACAALALFIPASLTAAYRQRNLEQEAAVYWVLENAAIPRGAKPLTEKKAQQIVWTAYYYGQERQIDPLQLLAIMRQESRFDAKAKSSVGAVGLMQVWPKWHQDKLAGRNPTDPKVSIDVGSQIYHDCLQKSAGNLRKAAKCYSGGARRYYERTEAHKKNLKETIESNLETAPAEMELVARR